MRPTLVFDADDTLWDEQGVLQRFEADVEALLGGGSDFRRRFIAMEEENIPTLGYGFASYLFSVAETLATNPSWQRQKPEILVLVAQLVAGMQSTAPRLIDDVRSTLEVLSRRRYRLVLLTRGTDAEQRAKLRQSGLASFFSDVRVVPSKDVDTYRRAARDLGDPSGSALCMIGNSMRSDVGPALAAGWRAIHVPAPTEWAHDHGAVADTTRFRRAEDFKGVAALVQSTGFWGQ